MLIALVGLDPRLAELLDLGLFLIAIPTLVWVLGLFQRITKHRVENEWHADVTDRDRDSVPVTSGDSIEDIHPRIMWAEEKRKREKIRIR